MRHALAGVVPEVMVPKGAVIVCQACGVPLYRLVANIWHGEKLGGTGWKFAPVEPCDLQGLVARLDLEPGQRAAVKTLDAADHCALIPALRNGEMPPCPSCGAVWVRAKTSEPRAEGRAEFFDRAYIVDLAWIPPAGMAKRAHA